MSSSLGSCSFPKVIWYNPYFLINLPYGFPLELVGVGKQKITGISHIKYAERMDIKSETDGLDGKISKN
jgi:hypothetical protein